MKTQKDFYNFDNMILFHFFVATTVCLLGQTRPFASRLPPVAYRALAEIKGRRSLSGSSDISNTQ